MTICSRCGADNRANAQFCSNCGRPLAQNGELAAGTLLQGRYRIMGKLASGGMGAVYLVEHTTLGEKMAVKEMHSSLLADPKERAEAVQQFHNEARILARLRHPHLPRVTDFFEETGKQYLVMDYVEGETLEQVLACANAPLRDEQAIEWALQICDVLDYLHGQNPPVIFRDLKPANVMIDRLGQVKLIDFGIARLFNPAKGTDTLKMGTPGYAPPEQYGGKGGTDPRSDVYALGALLHHLVTGHDPGEEPPFYFPTVPARKLNPSVSPQLEAVIARATEYEREKRYASAPEVKSALQASLGSLQPQLRLEPPPLETASAEPFVASKPASPASAQSSEARQVVPTTVTPPAAPRVAASPPMDSDYSTQSKQSTSKAQKEFINEEPIAGISCGVVLATVSAFSILIGVALILTSNPIGWLVTILAMIGVFFGYSKVR